MKAVLFVFLGAGFGGSLRYAVNIGCSRLFGAEFPWGILLINVTGSLAMGLIAGWFALRAHIAGAQDWRLFLTTGVLGGYTTFSAFALDFAVLWQRGAQMQAFVYLLASVLLSIVAVFAGLALMRAAS
ncbi:MAG: fluoride efflux transporter CrcB [Hyphomicrobiales bacterium]|nr:fluoride efflux transporter CrcB [Hyphomicrobiales bacterium]